MATRKEVIKESAGRVQILQARIGLMRHALRQIAEEVRKDKPALGFVSELCDAAVREDDRISRMPKAPKAA